MSSQHLSNSKTSPYMHHSRYRVVIGTK